MQSCVACSLHTWQFARYELYSKCFQVSKSVSVIPDFISTLKLMKLAVRSIPRHLRPHHHQTFQPHLQHPAVPQLAQSLPVPYPQHEPPVCPERPSHSFANHPSHLYLELRIQSTCSDPFPGLGSCAIYGCGTSLCLLCCIHRRCCVGVMRVVFGVGRGRRSCRLDVRQSSGRRMVDHCVTGLEICGRVNSLWKLLLTLQCLQIAKVVTIL